ncbi:hypothetical protein FIBSPDRAFT_59911 [Athelia psychrophila]|uniref:Uncharacterized protein n=1 Tax=Athelia psychrophila TaxID=1759441 RepID=A0A166F4L9_9AGAM|nr:hypothetical protein FIBSPDRAFT_318325 [Fibularhizoctonia sp. CBS 109695]KZP16430.1 hypothetical protein FIBSPDRAFT_59911 [Fibularhizoctonia sp. CBS 109695]
MGRRTSSKRRSRMRREIQVIAHKRTNSEQEPASRREARRLLTIHDSRLPPPALLSQLSRLHLHLRIMPIRGLVMHSPSWQPPHLIPARHLLSLKPAAQHFENRSVPRASPPPSTLSSPRATRTPLRECP